MEYSQQLQEVEFITYILHEETDKNPFLGGVPRKWSIDSNSNDLKSSRGHKQIMRFYNLWRARSLLFALLGILEWTRRVIAEQLLHTRCWASFPGQRGLAARGEGREGTCRSRKKRFVSASPLCLWNGELQCGWLHFVSPTKHGDSKD